MMISIRGLPPKTKYQDLKVLIRNECNINDFILDNLVDDNGYKKVRIGLADDSEGYRLIKCLNGLRMSGNFILNVEPVGKTGAINTTPLNTYEPRSGSGYPNQHRNDYPNQPTGNYLPDNNYNHGPAVSGGPQRPVVPSGHVPPGSMDGGRPSPWASNNAQNQWGTNQPLSTQIPQNSYGYQPTENPPFGQQHPSHQQRPETYAQQDSNFGYPTKSNMSDRGGVRQQDTRSHVLRNVEIVDTPLPHTPAATGRYPPSQGYPTQEKPITIMKDNFQGPSSYNVGNQQGPSYLAPNNGSSESWSQQGHQINPQPFSKPNIGQYEKPYVDNRRQLPHDKRPDLIKSSQQLTQPNAYKNYDKSTQGFPPSERRISPSGKRISPSRRRISPLARRISPPARHTSPIGRRISPSGRRISPSGDQISTHVRPNPLTGRRNSPSGRYSSLTDRRNSPGRRISPSARHVSKADMRNSPSERQMTTSGRHISPSGRRASPSGRSAIPGRPISPTRRLSPSGRHILNPGRRASPPGIPMSLSGRRISPSGRRMSPIGRRMSPPGKRSSPSERRMSPSERRISPSGRRMSPSGRRMSPSGRRMSPSGRRTSPSGRHISPTGRRMSPSRRKISPDEREIRLRNPRAAPTPASAPAPATAPSRYSPSLQHSDKLADKYSGPDSKMKQVRPAYESTQASNQVMYSGGFRPSVHENDQYPLTSHRQQDQRMSAWQQEKNKNSYPAMKKQDDDIRDVSRQILPTEKRHSPRKSRSPIRRDRSPIRDRYKRHSPSPRSPRRSWALEKRRSPDVRDAPPPPVWPGQNTSEDDNRTRFDRIEDKPKHTSMWDRKAFEEKLEKRMRPEEDRTPFESKLSVRNDLMRERAHSERFSHNQRDPKFSPRDDFEDRPSDFRRSDIATRKPSDNRQDIREFRRSPERDERRRHEEFRRESPHREANRTEFSKDFDPEFEDIFKRTQEFKRKAEELRKSGERRREERQTEDRSRRNMREEKNVNRRQDDTSRHFDERSRPEEVERFHDHEPEWEGEDNNHKKTMSDNIIAKREKAAEEIVERVMDSDSQLAELRGEHQYRVCNDLKAYLMRLFKQMFGDTDVSFIEIAIKYRSRFTEADEAKMVRDVLANLPIQYRSAKRPASETTHVPQKVARRSPAPNLREEAPRQKLSDPSIPDWNLNIGPPKLVTMPVLATPHIQQLTIPQLAAASQLNTQMQMSGMINPQPVMVPAPFVPTFEGNRAFDDIPDRYNLFLCQDDFEPFTEFQAERLKSFLIAQIIKFTEEQQGWAPDLTLKGMQSMHRYEIVTTDRASKDWLVNLDFSEFEYFNVLVYTKEELWYERAAVWLPGHTRNKKIKPYEKLKLQNQKLEGVNIGEWKFVKEISTMKGTRLYVDMPPSSARALETYKMQLSYELQKVSVFLKAVAIDKEAFDAGLKEPSITDDSALAAAVQNTPMPLIPYNSSAVKLTINGAKNITLEQARKIKEMVIYQIYKHHKEGGLSRTDFIKHGFFSPNYFSIEPENAESRRWLMSRHFGKLNRQSIVVVGGDEDNTKFFKMTVWVPHENGLNMALVFERIKQSNQGLKGVNFHLWKALRLWNDKRYAVLDVHMDLESVETIIKLKYTLDYVDSIHKAVVVTVKSEYSQSKLEESIKKYKAELSDSYVVANMELDSEDDDDVICLE